METKTESRLVSPRLVVSIDPGLRRLAWAAWADARLVGCGLTKTPDERNLNGCDKLVFEHAKQLPPYAHEVVVEGMLIQHGRTKDPRDMLDLAQISSFLAGWLRPERVHWTHGTQWKNNRPKEIQHQLDWAALHMDERATMTRCLESVTPSLRHNAKDAVGIGLYYLRKARKGMRP